ncbi:hypothetical protein ABOM_011639 [Aspergillus bombycis]|uniref:Uncharacterized protein n=1 Tax=Aspergillus bombycis TaxID=109264 RepID=A0A1F7ZJQ3_9EURO|nr:hypothetical protein ABOM_011639 [Aspergillus bombycis]OGM39690.1 hypothetical protein ABOM_011639 [Aspergillus bombycis]
MLPRTIPATARLFTSTAGKLPTAVPVIVCGKTSQVGDLVREALHPEYEVTHLFLSPSTAKNEIPVLLRQANSTTSTENGKSPAAIIMGGGYTNTDLDEIRAASQGPDARPVAWLKVDPQKTPSSLPVGPEYARAVAQRTKDRLDELVQNGGIHKDEVHFI